MQALRGSLPRLVQQNLPHIKYEKGRSYIF
nr:MAG TPA_asm: hypothetical protein [Bacteriophage sp.]